MHLYDHVSRYSMKNKFEKAPFGQQQTQYEKERGVKLEEWIRKEFCIRTCVCVNIV